jgi:hypothetical protein
MGESVSKEIARVIINQEIAGLEQGIYTLSVRGRVCGKVGDTQGQEQAAKQLEVLVKKLDAYKEELANVDK